MIMEDIYTFFDEFQSLGKLLKGSNVAYIALIAKIENPNGFQYFRPISMVGCIYNMIAKLLTMRMHKVMDSFIGPFQSSFIEGRQIYLMVLSLLEDLLNHVEEKKKKATIVNLTSTNLLIAQILKWTLQQIIFPSLQILSIIACVKSAEASILINGSSTIPLKFHWGLRQGDPLSPFLFDLVVETLSLVVQKTTSIELQEGVEISKEGIRLTHLQYADDTIIFCTPKIDSLLNIKKVLILFQLASGLQVNFHKSSLMGIHVEDSQLQMAEKSLLCKVGKLPFTYLRLPIRGNVNRIELWDPVIKRIKKKLAS